ncbi:MAG: hypothetical protein HYR84_04395 [Planctomycetes bacterium]|nr:hypothetical protein [Planctomycetota bacterium]
MTSGAAKKSQPSESLKRKRSKDNGFISFPIWHGQPKNIELCPEGVETSQPRATPWEIDVHGPDALKEHNKTMESRFVSPFQGFAALIAALPQGVALG